MEDWIPSIAIGIGSHPSVVESDDPVDRDWNWIPSIRAMESDDPVHPRWNRMIPSIRDGIG
jgi:hypothetical protein